MKLSCLAKRTRPDLLLAVSFLATRMKPQKTTTIFSLPEFMNICLQLRTKPLLYSLRTFESMLGLMLAMPYTGLMLGLMHTGIMIGFGKHRGLVYFRSSVQKIVSDSSTYAELIGQHDGIHTVEWMSYLMKKLGYPVDGDLTPIVYQDNNSALHLAQRGPGVVARSKHFHVRYFYIQLLNDNKELVLEYIPTRAMHADFFTKPNQGTIIILRVRFILGFPGNQPWFFSSQDMPVCLSSRTINTTTSD